MSQVEDFRDDCNLKHKLVDILTIAVPIVRSGVETWDDMELYGKERLPLPNSFHHLQASLFARWIRAHRGIENQLHWVLDVAFNEDSSLKRAGHSAENFSRLLRFARNILKRYKDLHPTKLSYRSMKFKAALQQDFALEVLKAVFCMTCFA